MIMPAQLTESSEPAIHIDRAEVCLSRRPIWSDITLDVYPGEFLAVLGPNGAGKSTLIKAILGLIPLSGGTIQVLGGSSRRGRTAIGYVPQRRVFGPDVHVRARDLVSLGMDGSRWGIPLPGIRRLWGGSARAREDSVRVREAIEAVGAGDYANRPIGALSGGEQQRILIAEALVTRPRILLLDEPLAGLDLHNQQGIAAVLHRIRREHDTAVVLVSHDVNPLLPYADRVCYIVRGHMACGRPEEIITTDVLSELYGFFVEVLRTRDGRLVVVGQPALSTGVQVVG